jgi:hypothetical protein
MWLKFLEVRNSQRIVLALFGISRGTSCCMLTRWRAAHGKTEQACYREYAFLFFLELQMNFYWKEKQSI